MDNILLENKHDALKIRKRENAKSWYKNPENKEKKRQQYLKRKDEISARKKNERKILEEQITRQVIDKIRRGEIKVN